jgi:hypothetical protein
VKEGVTILFVQIWLIGAPAFGHICGACDGVPRTDPSSSARLGFDGHFGLISDIGYWVAVMGFEDLVRRDSIPRRRVVIKEG